LHRLEEESGRTLLNGERLVAPVSSYGDGVDTVIITGLPVPMVSYGGTAMIATFAGLGLVQSVHMRRFT
jgi:hypothetical protein